MRSHFNVGLNTGLTEAQLKDIVSELQTKVGSKEGNIANEVLQLVLNKSKSTDVSKNSKQVIVQKVTFPKTIFPRGEKITNDNFIGNAWLLQMITPDNLNSTQVGNVTFEQGARTNWHMHPGGQILLITGGTGYYQEKGSPKRTIKKGEVVKCPPGVPHWHGASKDDELIQIAITNTQKGATVWLERVTDETYNE